MVGGTPRALEGAWRALIARDREVDVHPSVAGALALCAVASVVGCVDVYHPEYHPETSYSYVQNVITVVTPPPVPPAPIVVLPAAPPPVAPVRTFHAASVHKSLRHESPAPEPREAQLAPMFASDQSRTSDGPRQLQSVSSPERSAWHAVEQ
jgi:hypothetical protein